jgi:uncharacterized protein YqhQ
VPIVRYRDAGEVDMKPSDIEEIRDHISDTYFRLRIVMAAIAFCFPLVLLLVGLFLYNIPIQDNMSAYYFAFHPETPVEHVFPMRIWFVGFLWAIGFCLIIYKGFSLTEYRLLNLAGLCALGVALLPAVPPDYCAAPIAQGAIVSCGSTDTAFVHQVLAAGIFACAAYVAAFCSETTLDYVKGQMQFVYRSAYYLLATIMVVTALIGLVVSFWPASSRWVFIIETVGFCTFAIYWLVKTVEIHNSELEKSLMTPGLRRSAESPGDEARKSVRRWLSRALG